MRYFLISIGSKTLGSVDHDGLKAELNMLKNWVKFHYNQYMVLTGVGSKELNDIVRRHIGVEDTAIVVELNIQNRRGTVPKILADWLKTDHSTEEGR